MKLVTPEQFSELIQLHPETVKRHCRAGKIPGAFALGKVWRIDLDRFEAALESVAESPSGAPSKTKSKPKGWS